MNSVNERSSRFCSCDSAITVYYHPAAGGRAVLTTIHQPSSRLFRRLDRLMLLAEGHCIYYGATRDVIDWCVRDCVTLVLFICCASAAACNRFDCKAKRLLVVQTPV